MKTPMNEPITMFKKQFNFLSIAVPPSKLEVNKIAARWPAKAVAQLFTFSKKGSDRIVPR